MAGPLMPGVPIFLYGTLLDDRALARHSRDPRLPRATQPAILLGHRRVVLRGTPYPPLRQDQRGAVAGELIRPSPVALRHLAAYEGAAYRLHPILVLTPRGPRRARAWVAFPHRAGTAPWP